MAIVTKIDDCLEKTSFRLPSIIIIITIIIIAIAIAIIVDITTTTFLKKSFQI